MLYNHNYCGQALQDQFVVTVLKDLSNGHFLEIGAKDPIIENNSYVLEKDLNWKGVIVENNESLKDKFESERPNSIHILQDATQVDYYSVLQQNNFPKNMDYLEIYLEVNDRSTLTTLELLNNTVFPEYKFAIVTFQHDVHRGDFHNTRLSSREIFINAGYILVFCDVRIPELQTTSEDWYMHPDLVDINYINEIKRDDSMSYKEIIQYINDYTAT